MQVTVYILLCSDGSYYTGLTKKPVEARVQEHETGLYKGYTSRLRPVALVYAELHTRLIEAIARERQIKQRSRRKKEALIHNALAALPDLASRPRRS